jgi:hypothetical protein
MAELNRKKIRKALPHGKVKAIAELAGVSQGNVSNWFRGLFNSDRIEGAAIQVYSDYMKQKKNRLKKIQQAQLA